MILTCRCDPKSMTGMYANDALVVRSKANANVRGGDRVGGHSLVGIKFGYAFIRLLSLILWLFFYWNKWCPVHIELNLSAAFTSVKQHHSGESRVNQRLFTLRQSFDWWKKVTYLSIVVTERLYCCIRLSTSRESHRFSQYPYPTPLSLAFVYPFRLVVSQNRTLHCRRGLMSATWLLFWIFFYDGPVWDVWGFKIQIKIE